MKKVFRININKEIRKLKLKSGVAITLPADKTTKNTWLNEVLKDNNLKPNKNLTVSIINDKNKFKLNFKGEGQLTCTYLVAKDCYTNYTIKSPVILEEIKTFVGVNFLQLFATEASFQHNFDGYDYLHNIYNFNQNYIHSAYNNVMYASGSGKSGHVFKNIPNDDFRIKKEPIRGINHAYAKEYDNKESVLFVGPFNTNSSKFLEFFGYMTESFNNKWETKTLYVDGLPGAPDLKIRRRGRVNGTPVYEDKTEQVYSYKNVSYHPDIYQYFTLEGSDKVSCSQTVLPLTCDSNRVQYYPDLWPLLFSTKSVTVRGGTEYIIQVRNCGSQTYTVQGNGGFLGEKDYEIKPGESISTISSLSPWVEYKLNYETNYLYSYSAYHGYSRGYTKAYVPTIKDYTSNDSSCNFILTVPSTLSSGRRFRYSLTTPSGSTLASSGGYDKAGYYEVRATWSSGSIYPYLVLTSEYEGEGSFIQYLPVKIN